MNSLGSPLSALIHLLRRLRRLLLVRRRLLAALLTVVAVAAALQTVAPPAPATVPLSVAARDLPTGRVLSADDLTELPVSPDSMPAGATPVPELVGETLAAPVRRGEPLTDLRLVGASYLAEQPPGLSAVPVRIPDPGVAGLIEQGERIDLFATDPNSGRSRPVARSALVLDVPAQDDSTSSVMTGSTGRLVVVGIPTEEVTEVAGSAARLFLSVAFPD